jgi:hypothetical protein
MTGFGALWVPWLHKSLIEGRWTSIKGVEGELTSGMVRNRTMPLTDAV